MTDSGQSAPPDPRDCVQPSDIGKLHHDPVDDIWYECIFDSRRSEYTWAIVPPAD